MFLTTRPYLAVKHLNMPSFLLQLRITGAAFTLLGLLHMVYLAVAVEVGAPDTLSYWGGHFFGVAYTAFGLHFLAGKSRWLLVAFIVNSIGLLAMLKANFITPLWDWDPYFLAADLLTVPVLFWLYRTQKRLHAA